LKDLIFSLQKFCSSLQIEIERDLSFDRFFGRSLGFRKKNVGFWEKKLYCQDCQKFPKYFDREFAFETKFELKRITLIVKP